MPRKGYKQTEEHREKCCKKRFGNTARRGKPAWNKGLKGVWKATPEQRANMSKSKKGKYLKEKSWSWKGGKTKTQKLEEKAGRSKPKYCEVCGRGGMKICYDHDHITGKFRGWLCTNCNITLGHMGDNKEILYKLIDYLEKNK